jgi:hypothetical protein
MSPAVHSVFVRELEHARNAESDGEVARLWTHLERAHVLSQAHAWSHVRVHVRMAAFALRRRDLREILGQIPRILLAAPGSWTGRAPRGNTGGVNVGISTPMEILADLQALLDE